MEREHDLIELGTASRETQGPGGPVDDQALGIPFPGLLED
jgi:hypothetical protein